VPHFPKETKIMRETDGHQDFPEIRKVYTLQDWIGDHAAEAVQVLGRKNTKLVSAETRLVVWPFEVRHSDVQLRAIWKFCNESCHRLAPYGEFSCLCY
jgi:hypothetical protein